MDDCERRRTKETSTPPRVRDAARPTNLADAKDLHRLMGWVPIMQFIHEDDMARIIEMSVQPPSKRPCSSTNGSVSFAEGSA